MEDVLSDAPRDGSTGTFTAEQVTQILATACEPAEQSGRPIDRWTHRELADEVIQRGIVPSISVSQIGRYLREFELQPHRSKYWLNTKEKDPELFQQQVERVCRTYLDAPALLRYHPLFDSVVLDAAEWYDGRQPNLGADFLARVRKAVNRLIADPERRTSKWLSRRR